MGPKASMSEENLYRYPLLEPITLKHLPVCLADPIDWDRSSAAMEDSFMSKREHPTTSQRLIAELLCWQVFTGETNLQNESPIGYRTLTRRRKRLGDAGVEELNGRAKRILSHKPKSKHKLYARYTSEVECLVKGGARKPDEFGVQVSITTTQKEGQVASVRSMRRKSVRWAHAGRDVGAGSDSGRIETAGRSGVRGLDAPRSDDFLLVFEARDHADIESDDQAAQRDGVSNRRYDGDRQPRAQLAQGPALAVR